MRLLFSCLVLTSLGASAFASCGEGKLPKHRIAFSWNGLSSSVRYNAGAKVFHEQLASRMERHFLARGNDRSSGDEAGAPSWAPNPPEATVTLTNATKGGLRQAADAITQEVARLRQDGSAADEVELVMYVTNHGTKFLQGPNGPGFGIRTRPRDDDGHELPREDANLRADDLRAFAARLPKGIRVKTIFAQCFGSNTSETLLDAIDSPELCKCGVSKADLGYPAWGIENSQGGINQSWSHNWDHRVIGVLAGGGNLAEARAVGLLGYDSGVSPVTSIDRNGNSLESINSSLSTSQITILKSLTRAFRAELPGIENWSQREFFSQANRVLRRAGERRLSPEAQAELARRREEHKRWASQLGIPDEMLREERDRFRAFLGDAPYLSADDWVAHHSFGGAMDANELREFLRRRAARTLALQEGLEETFFKKADAGEVSRFLAKSACERDPLMTVPPTPVAPPPRVKPNH